MRNILASEAVKKLGGVWLLHTYEQKDNRWDFCKVTKMVKIKQSRYKPGVAQRVPGS
jgi:hypothetical protein